MRVIGGKFRGRKLADVGQGDVAAHLRPTTDRIRENIFNLLVNGPSGDAVTGRRVLDLFAGTGALAVEALSRGAICAEFVDNGRAALGLIQQNIASLGLGDVTSIKNMDATQLPFNRGKAFDLVFLDPPYKSAAGEQALERLLHSGWLASDAFILWETGEIKAVPVGYRLLKQKKYGKSWVSILSLA